jgi:glycosyltransferase involved in cell wall biosynthesis
VLAVSRVDRDELVRRGLSEGRVLLHLNGVDARRVDPASRDAERARVRAAWNLTDEDGLAIGVVARLSREKRHDLALDAAAHLAALDPSLRWRLLFFGSGALEGELRARIESLGLGARVELRGYRANLGDEMAGFDVLLSLSDAEGLPLNLVEAGWAATPVCSTAVGGIPDLLGEPPAGVLVERRGDPATIARALHALLVDEPRRRALGEAFQKRVESGFSRRAWLARLEEIYKPLLDRTASAHR